MAEKVVIPKTFTKEWFGYVWDYYRYHIIGGIVVVALLVMTGVELADRVEYDANINYVATDVISLETSEKIADACKTVSDDVNGDEETNINLTQLNFTHEAAKDPNLYTALTNKLMTTFAVEDEFIYIMDKTMMNEVLNMSATEGVFIPVGEWADQCNEDEIYGASLKESTLLNNYEINTENLYILVRMNYDADNSELSIKEENAIKIANFLLK